jgi:hypothetical protein
VIIQFATKDGKSLTSHHEVWKVCVIYFLDPMAPQASKAKSHTHTRVPPPAHKSDQTPLQDRNG